MPKRVTCLATRSDQRGLRDLGAYGDGGAGDPLSFAGADTSSIGLATILDSGVKLVAPDAQAGDLFGNAVAISGDYAIVGAYQEDGGAGDSLDRAGAAYIFHRTGDNSWDDGVKLVASDAQAGDRFGVSVGISGDYAIVGAREEDGGAGDPLSNAGAAYIFH
jgi:hypothetical protein